MRDAAAPAAAGTPRRKGYASFAGAGAVAGIDGVLGSGHTCTRWVRGDMPKNSR
jgi:hypothetical protein